MTQEQLVSLGFERIDVSAEESGDVAFYYYTLDFGSSGFSLITCDDADAKEHGWFVEIFDYENIRFENYQDVSDFIRIVNKNMI